MQVSMLSAVSALRSHQSYMDVVANNIANVNTPGFKQQRISFLDLLSQTLSPGQQPDPGANQGGINPVQVGLGMRTGSIDTIFTQGMMQATGRPADLAIQGDGFFILTGPDDTLYYTRDGNFGLDAEGYLIHLPTGYRVANENGDALDQIFDPVADTNVVSWQVQSNGAIALILDDGTTQAPGGGDVGDVVVGLSRFANPGGLLRVGENLYQPSLNSGEAVNGQPATEGFGVLNAGYLERSNVDLAKNLTDMIIAQRGFQANSRIITASDQILRDLVNLAR